MAAGPPAEAEIARVVRQQMLYVYMLFGGGIVFVAENLILYGFSYPLSRAGGWGLGFGVAAFLFLGAAYMQRGIRQRAERMRLAARSAPAVGGEEPSPSAPAPSANICSECGRDNLPLTHRCAACNAPLGGQTSFWLEPSRSEADIRQLQAVFGLVSAFLAGLLAWALSPLARSGREFEAYLRGGPAVAGVWVSVLFLALLGPLAAWVAYMALTIRRTSGRAAMVLGSSGVTIWDDSGHRLHLEWADPEFRMRLMDTAGNAQFDRQVIILQQPKRGSGSANFSRVGLEALGAAASAHGLAVSTTAEQMFSAGTVRVTTIAASFLPPMPQMQPPYGRSATKTG